MTHQDFQNKLKALQIEQAELLNSPDRRKKVVRNRITEITRLFYAIKQEWRETLGEYNPSFGVGV